MTSTQDSTRTFAGLTITHIVARDGFGGEETAADVDAYCQAVADRLGAQYPGADVTVETGLGVRTRVTGALATAELDEEVRTAAREIAHDVWEAGDFWTDREELSEADA